MAQPKLNLVVGQIYYLAHHGNGGKVTKARLKSLRPEAVISKTALFTDFEYLSEGLLKGYTIDHSLGDSGVRPYNYDRRPQMICETYKQAKRAVRRADTWFNRVRIRHTGDF